MMSGFVYGLTTNNSDSIRYIGMTTQGLSKRLSGHKKAANSGKKYPLYDWMRKQGVENIRIVLVEVVETDLASREIYWIQDFLNRNVKLLNLTAGGLGPNGHVWTSEQRQAHSVKMKEVVNRPDVREKILKNRKTTYGNRHSDAQKKKWSKERKGSITGVKNPNWGKFGSDHPAYGRVLSKETKKRLSEQKRGKGNPNYGKPLSEETRKKMSIARKGRPMPSSVRSAHTRWHTNKNIVNPKCTWCTEKES